MSVVVVAGGPGGRVVDGLRGLVGGPVVVVKGGPGGWDLVGSGAPVVDGPGDSVVVVTGGPGEFVVVLGSGPVVLDGLEESVV